AVDGGGSVAGGDHGVDDPARAVHRGPGARAHLDPSAVARDLGDRGEGEGVISETKGRLHRGGGLRPPTGAQPAGRVSPSALEPREMTGEWRSLALTPPRGRAIVRRWDRHPNNAIRAPWKVRPDRRRIRRPSPPRKQAACGRSPRASTRCSPR